MTASPYVLLDDSLTPGGRSLLFTEPERIVSAYEPEEVEAALDAISAGLTRGLHAAGFFAYEFGYCLEPKLRPLLPQTARQQMRRRLCRMSLHSISPIFNRSCRMRRFPASICCATSS